MGAITRSVANGITTNGVVLKSIINNDSFDNVTALPSSFGDGITLISSQTASNSASLSFASGLTSTYKAYKFVFVNIHPASTSVQFQFNMSTDSGSNYNVTKTTTMFVSVHRENGTEALITYDTGRDLAQSTSFQPLSASISTTNSDDSVSGSLILFNPSSTTYVKHFISNANTSHVDPASHNNYSAGYGNTTSAVNAIRFQMSSGNIDAGTIYLYGIK